MGSENLKKRILLYALDDDPRMARRRGRIEALNIPIAVRNPQYWRGETEKCTAVLLHETETELIAAYEKSGAKIKKVRSRVVADKTKKVSIGVQTAAAKISAPPKQQISAADKAKISKSKPKKTVKK